VQETGSQKVFQVSNLAGMRQRAGEHVQRAGGGSEAASHPLLSGKPASTSIGPWVLFSELLQRMVDLFQTA